MFYKHYAIHFQNFFIILNRLCVCQIVIHQSLLYPSVPSTLCICAYKIVYFVIKIDILH